jgi:hypothetical protein
MPATPERREMEDEGGMREHSRMPPSSSVAMPEV